MEWILWQVLANPCKFEWHVLSHSQCNEVRKAGIQQQQQKKRIMCGCLAEWVGMERLHLFTFNTVDIFLKNESCV